MKAWTLTAAALAATLTLAGCADAPASVPTGAPEEGHVQQADNAEAYARAKALGCTFLEGGAVRCPRFSALDDITYFPSVDRLPPPRAPRRMEDVFDANLIEVFRRDVADPKRSGRSAYEITLFRYVLENLEAEEAMVEAGCATTEDACAKAVREALGWSGFESPGAAAHQAERISRAEARRRPK